MRLHELLEQKEHGGKRTEAPAYGNNYIYNPSIMDIEVGNMIRVYGRPQHKNFEPSEGLDSWGQMVLDVDYKNGMILVVEYQGGTQEFKEWVSIDDVKVTWNIGGYEAAVRKKDELDQAVQDVMHKRMGGK